VTLSSKIPTQEGKCIKSGEGEKAWFGLAKNIWHRGKSLAGQTCHAHTEWHSNANYYVIKVFIS